MDTHILEWFEKLEKSATDLRDSRTSEVHTWAPVLTELHSALDSVFPPNHVILKRWEDARAHGRESVRGHDHQLPERWVIPELVGVFQTAVKLLKDGHARRLADGIRAETIGHCLDQADALARSGYAVAAMVLAGGALETHLRNLCARFGLTWPGEGSIAKYNQALGQARNLGTQELVTSSDSSLIESWGKDRNEAAHTPATFSRSATDVLAAVEGIKQFLARTE
jgi:hypothetical protein